MIPRPISNPPNPWSTTEVEYLEQAPDVKLQVFEDHTKQILAHNDSPDLGFSWSVNPYRGCFHACAYCLCGDTRILLSDGKTKAISDIAVGDEIIGTFARRRVRTQVLAKWPTVKAGYRVALDGGTELVASGDHRFLSDRGWAYVHDLDRGSQLVALDGLRRVQSIECVAKAMPMFDITTGTGDFIANGVVSHNCYARPTHEYLSFGAGTDFDRKIVVKPNAPELLREAFDKPSWKGELIVFSGNTDCYQPLEASYRITRGCIEVCAEYRNPIAVITKAPLIERDIDVLCALAEVTNLSVTISIPFWDVTNARAIEPYVATPERRIRIIEKLARAGIQVGVNVAPIIPGLNDEDMPDILAAAREAGAVYASMVILRLPGPVKAVFEERIRASLPLRADKILARVRETQGGKLYDARFGKRGKATGEYGTAIKALFEATKRRLGYPAELPERHALTFRRPDKPGTQMKLF